MRRIFLAATLAGMVSVAGCGNVNLSKPIDSADWNAHLATAQNYVNIAYAGMAACTLTGLPMCSSSKIAQVKAVVEEALAQARQVGADNPTLGQTLLRVAMNAVLAYAGTR